MPNRPQYIQSSCSNDPLFFRLDWDDDDDGSPRFLFQQILKEGRETPGFESLTVVDVLRQRSLVVQDYGILRLRRQN